MAKKTTNGITHETIIRAVQAGDIAPVYYLMGEESYYIDRLAAYIASQVLTEEERDFNLITLFGTETTTHDVVHAALSYPMGSERQVVIVKEAQALRDIDGLEGYLKKPQPSTVLVFCHKNGTLDKRKSVSRLIEKVGVLYESARLRDYQLPPWIRDYLRRRKVGIEPQAESMMAEYVGPDLNRMAGELDKLILSLNAAVANGGSAARIVTPALVAEHIGLSKEFNVFELTDALAQKNVLKIRQITNYFDKNPKQNPIQKTLPVIFKFFQNLMMAYYSPDRTAAGIAAWVGMNPYVTEKTILPAMRLYTGRDVLAIIGQIRRTDARSKGVENPATSDSDLMKELMFFILHEPSRQRLVDPR